MNNRIRARFAALRRLVTLSPRITVLTIFTLAVLVAMLVLGIAVISQSAAAGAVIGYNNADVNRPFVQLQRETLRLITVVRADPATFDAKAVSLQRNLVESRLVVLNYPLVQDSLPPESVAASKQIANMWIELTPALDKWAATPGDTALQQQVARSLTDFEFFTNTSEIRYQQLRGEAVQLIGQSSQGLLLAIGIMSLLLIVFMGVVVFSVVRFVRERQLADKATREAMAAEAAALETNRFKDQFLAVMSHELRTPLNAIIGFLGIISMAQTLEERTLHMVERARSNADRLLTLINDILDLSKIESGRLELIPTPLSPRELAARWGAQMDVLAKQKGVDFVVRIDPALPDNLLVDEDAITKIVTNLLGNAFKFTEQGQVRLKMENVDSKWVIAVEDSGIGIPGHMHETIFEAFKQVDGTSKRAYGGTGLGLSIVQKLVKAMNGTIRVDSIMGKGSTFTVTLPLVLATDQQSPVAQLAGAPS